MKAVGLGKGRKEGIGRGKVVKAVGLGKEGKEGSRIREGGKRRQ